MKLVASMIVAEVEVDRYLEPCVGHLLEFCDEVVLLADGYARIAVAAQAGVVLVYQSEGTPTFFDHEGRARQKLLDVTLERDPTHILAIDADEFVADGALLRSTLERDELHAVWSLCMQEVWEANEHGLRLRQDGGWSEHDVPILYAPGRLSRPLLLPDLALASGRTPGAVRGARTGHSGTAILHFGWANVPERIARAERYRIADGGRFHAGSHLDSILWPDERVTTNSVGWPELLGGYRERILSHAGATE